ncbi:hypothetical protein PRBEI_2001831800 [Prionailurus iriomotensis]
MGVGKGKNYPKIMEGQLMEMIIDKAIKTQSCYMVRKWIPESPLGGESPDQEHLHWPLHEREVNIDWCPHGQGQDQRPQVEGILTPTMRRILLSGRAVQKNTHCQQDC